MGAGGGPLLASPSVLFLPWRTCPTEAALSASFGDLRGQPQERETERRTPGMITAKGEPVAMLTRLGEKERRRLCQNEKGGEHSCVFYLYTKMPTEEGKEIRKA